MAITETGLSAIASGAESSIKSQGGSIEGREGNYRVTFPEGTERLPSSSISAWKPNESSVSRWQMPNGDVLSYWSDWEDQTLKRVHKG